MDDTIDEISDTISEFGMIGGLVRYAGHKVLIHVLTHKPNDISSVDHRGNPRTYTEGGASDISGYASTVPTDQATPSSVLLTPDTIRTGTRATCDPGEPYAAAKIPDEEPVVDTLQFMKDHLR